MIICFALFLILYKTSFVSWKAEKKIKQYVGSGGGSIVPFSFDNEATIDALQAGGLHMGITQHRNIDRFTLNWSKGTTSSL